MPTPFRSIRLPNGLRVIISPLKETQAVTCLVLCRVGSRYETADVSGASHFLEHLVFKGTARRPTTLDITKELDAVGAEFNAFTAKDHTGYYVKAAAEHLPLALDVLSDILFHSRFDPAEIDRERGVILQEINMYEDNPLMNAEDLFERAMFGRHPLGQMIAGPKAVIRQVSRAALLRYRERFYDPRNMVISIAGNVPANAAALVRKYFLKATSIRQFPPFKRFRPTSHPPRVVLTKKPTEQVQLTLGFPAYPYEHPRLFPLYLLNVILGGNMSSRLFIAIRERQGLCYSIRSSVSPYQDTGTFSVQAGLDRTRLPKAITSIVKELILARKGVTSDELRKAKDFLKGKFILELEDSEHIASFYGRQAILTGRTRTPAKNLRRIDRVTRNAVRDAARDIIRNDRAVLSLIGPVESVAPLKQLLRFGETGV